MKPDISEFSYGYALTENLVQWAGSGLTAAPYFPSLREEGNPSGRAGVPSGGGYDVWLPFPSVPMFLQFKLSDYMTRAWAECYEMISLPRPFYKFHLRPLKSSQQHQLLTALEEKGNEVFYAAPAFHKVVELNDAYLGRKVADRSLYFRPSAIKLPKKGEHHVVFTYKAGPPQVAKAWRCSEPVEINVLTSSQLANEMRAHIDKYSESIGRESRALSSEERRMMRNRLLPEQLRRTYDSMVQVIREEISHNVVLPVPSFSLDELSASIAYLSRLYFHAEYMQVGLPLSE